MQVRQRPLTVLVATVKRTAKAVAVTSRDEER